MAIKNLVTISLTVFIIALFIILGVGSAQNQKMPSQQTNVNLNSSSSQVNNSGITANQVALHNSFSNCWVIINSRVYDLTSYMPIHPGGPGQIIPYCGRDATIAFDTKGGQGQHSQSAANMLINYFVGNLAK